MIPNEGLIGGEGGELRTLVPNKIFLVFPCSLKVCLRFWCSLFPKIYFVPVFPVLFSFCSHVPRKFIAMFPCSLRPLGENISITLHKSESRRYCRLDFTPGRILRFDRSVSSFMEGFKALSPLRLIDKERGE